MLRILTEDTATLSDVEQYLKSQDFIDKLKGNLGSDLSIVPVSDICDEVIMLVSEKDINKSIKVNNVLVCKVIGESIDILEQAYQVITFNGNYYDFGAQRFNQAFDGLIKEGNLPVVQPVITSDKSISERVSTMKGYVLLGY